MLWHWNGSSISPDRRWDDSKLWVDICYVQSVEHDVDRQKCLTPHSWWYGSPNPNQNDWFSGKQQKTAALKVPESTRTSIALKVQNDLNCSQSWLHNQTGQSGIGNLGPECLVRESRWTPRGLSRELQRSRVQRAESSKGLKAAPH